jgi:8-amino-7-oxononanoate synthase
MSSLDTFLSACLAERKQQYLYRERKILDSAQGVRVVVNKKRYISFCSNDYLGLANHPKVIEAFKRGAGQYGVGSGASHLVSGHSRAHHQLEEELAAFTGRDRALLFSSGYLANLGLISALVGKKDCVFEDKLNHASLIDAGLLSGARFQRYLHNDVTSLQKYLQKNAVNNQERNNENSNTLVVADGVFSMDGDIVCLPELAQLAQKHEVWLMMDDAHGFGVLGKNGAGTAEHFNLSQQQLPILMGTLGKALGTFGAFVAGSNELIEYLIQFSRSYIYTTALPPAVAEAARTSLKLLQEESARREQLHANIREFRRCAEQINLPLMESQTAIQPLVIGDNDKVMRISAELNEKGFLVGAIRPPTVPVGSARLRITLCAEHARQDIHQLLDALSVALHG